MQKTENAAAVGIGEPRQKKESQENPNAARHKSQGFFNFNNAPRQDGLFEFCSGIGAYYSTNPDAKDPKPHYLETTMPDIKAMLENPPSAPKDQARWFIPSTYPSRVHAEQRERGLFGCSWFDGDKVENKSFDDVLKIAKEISPYFIAYTSRSAKKETPKFRILIPLKKLVDGQTYCILQKIINDKFEDLGIIPDRATERAGQLCYLPNRGQFYKYHVQDHSEPVDAETYWKNEIEAERDREAAEKQARAERMEQARLKAAEMVANGTESPIQAFNNYYDLEDVLLHYGNIKQGEKYISVNSESKNPGIIIKDKKWISHHSSDDGIGTIGKKGGRYGDAFDLFCHYEHGGDYKTAIKGAAEMFNCQGFSKEDQREYMENKNREETYQAFDAEEPQQNSDEKPKTKKPFSLNKFILNGQSEQMRAQMLMDEYILDKTAISGQATVYYAKANIGKTLLTMWMLRRSIETKQVDPKNIYYINADDTFKGLAFKVEMAEKQGFNMLAPGFPPENPFKHEHIVSVLQSEGAHKKTIILDTVKKFTDLMSKKEGTKFGTDIRSFVSRGGSVIMLAHVNKYNDADGKPIYSGTTDLVDDSDCAYTINLLKEDQFTGTRSVMFENFKNRGDVELEVTFEYDYRPETSYFKRLESVKRISKEDHRTLLQQQAREKVYRKNEDAVEAIKAFLRTGQKTQTEIVKELSENHGISRRKSISALKDHTGDDFSLYYFWNTSPGDKNAKIYHLVL